MNSSALPFFLFLLLFLGLLDWYVFSGVQSLIGSLSQPKLRLALRLFYWLTFAVEMGSLLYGMFLFSQRNPDTYHQSSLFLSVVIAIVVPKLVFALLLLAGDAARPVEWLIRLVFGDGEDKSFPGRRKFFSQLAVVAGGIPFLGMIYGIVKGKYDFTVRRLTLRFPDLPKAFHGFTLTQISDVHSGSFDNVEAVQKGIDMIQETGSDIIVFTGDLVNNYATEIEPWIERFGALSAPEGKYSITGNHDYGDYGQWPSPEAKVANFDLLQQQHGKMGFRLLMNEQITFEREGEKISLVGIENWGLPPFPQHGDLNRAIQGAAPFKILLSHDPSHWDAEVIPHEQTFHLTLAGHTHGMQFGIEIPGFRWSPVKYRYPRWAGLYERASQFLYVNRGFGFLAFSGRVGIWPEITVITLESELV